MKIPTRLKMPRWSKVDLVDRPADGHAKIAIWKREGSVVGGEYEEEEEDDSKVDKREFSAEKRRELAKVGKALPDGSFPIVSKEDLSNAIQAFGRASDKSKAKAHIVKRAKDLSATDMLPDDWTVSKKEEGTVPEKLKEEVLKGLPEDVQEHLTELYKSLEDQGDNEPPPGDGGDAPPAGDDPTDITKREDVPEDVKSIIAKRDEELAELRKRFESNEKVLKNERDARLTREWRDKVEKFDGIVDDVNETASELKELADVNPDLADKLVKRLEVLKEQADTSGLFEEIGKAETYANSAEGKIEAVVKSIRDAEPTLTEAAAYEKALDLHPELYSAYVTEKGA